MYTPAYARCPDPELPYELMRSRPFAALITVGEGGVPEVNHYPFHLVREHGASGVLWTHLARSSPQCAMLRDGEECWVIFQGPDAYVSPRHYDDPLNVPTWNYAATHARCRIRRIEDAGGVDRILHALVDRFEREEGGEAWRYELPADFRNGLLRAILGMELEILEVQSKFKLSQNREQRDYERVLGHFGSRPDDRGREIHELMLRTRRSRPGSA